MKRILIAVLVLFVGCSSYKKLQQDVAMQDFEIRTLQAHIETLEQWQAAFLMHDSTLILGKGFTK